MLAGTHVTRTLSVNMNVVKRYARLTGSRRRILDTTFLVMLMKRGFLMMESSYFIFTPDDVYELVGLLHEASRVLDGELPVTVFVADAGRAEDKAISRPLSF